MKRMWHRYIVESLHRFHGSTVQRFNAPVILVCALLFPLSVRAQFSAVETGSAHSASGQFIITGGQGVSRLASVPFVATNASLVRLEPALLAVSAERIKDLVRGQLGIARSAAWSGTVFLMLHPARSLDENVTIVSTRLGKGWNYRVELPDIVSRTRLARALTGVLLLEFSNRNAGGHPAEIPAWLTDGLSQQLSTPGLPENVFSRPSKSMNNIPVTWLTNDTSGIDLLAEARRVLKSSTPLTFDQLSWPGDAQVSGADGGAYRACAQLFVSSLLGLQDGPAHLREMLQVLPRFYNWQTAFQNAFRENFSTPLDVEKWWALQVVDYAAHDPGPVWTPAASRDRLDEILSVPVEMRATSNSLPARAEISLQAVMRNFALPHQREILQARLRDLGLARFRMAAPLAALTDDYRRAIGDYLDAGNLSSRRKNGADATVKKLDALDARRRIVEDAIKPDDSMPQNLNAHAP